ncbi:MAG: RNA polymerase sigma factor [Polyangiaceae bacterium]|nr:RNA polymerase sigma factor [Polyangiaceae bacterium]
MSVALFPASTVAARVLKISCHLSHPADVLMFEFSMMSFLWPSRDDRHCDLLRAALRGNRDAFRTLYRELYGPVTGFVGRRIGHPQDAEDVVAIVFHKFLERLGDYDAKRGTVRMYVLAIARSAVIDWLRAVRDDVPVDDLAGSIADGGESPLDALVRGEKMGQLHKALLAISAPSREVLVLRFGDGLSHAEIAELLGMKVDAVKQRSSRAMRELEAQVKKMPSLKDEMSLSNAETEGVTNVRF